MPSIFAGSPVRLAPLVGVVVASFAAHRGATRHRHNLSTERSDSRHDGASVRSGTQSQTGTGWASQVALLDTANDGLGGTPI
jgi:hypothetical protein